MDGSWLWEQLTLYPPWTGLWLALSFLLAALTGGATLAPRTGLGAYCARDTVGALALYWADSGRAVTALDGCVRHPLGFGPTSWGRPSGWHRGPACNRSHWAAHRPEAPARYASVRRFARIPAFCERRSRVSLVFPARRSVGVPALIANDEPNTPVLGRLDQRRALVAGHLCPLQALRRATDSCGDPADDNHSLSLYA